MRFVVIADRRHASSKKQIERLIQVQINAIPGQDFRKARAAQHLAIDQYAVAVEDDEIGLGHPVFPYQLFPGQSEHMLRTRAITHLPRHEERAEPPVVLYARGRTSLDARHGAQPHLRTSTNLPAIAAAAALAGERRCVRPLW